MAHPTAITPFRIESRSASHASSQGLEQELQRRLRVLAAIWGIVFAAAGVAGVSSRHSFLPTAEGGLISPLSLAVDVPLTLLFVLAVVMFTPRRRVSLRWLRAFEVLFAGVLASFITGALVQDVRYLRPAMSLIPVDLAFAHASMWRW